MSSKNLLVDSKENLNNMNKNDNSLALLRNLFPTKMSFFVFIAYMALFINQGLLVTASKNKDNKFNYNPITVVLMTELLKLLFSSAIYLKKYAFIL